MASLFAYGTLMCDDIMRSVAGFLPEKREGRLLDYRRLVVKNDHYPGLVRHRGREVDGIVYFDIPEKSWKRLDGFEGEMYSRQIVNVLLGDGSLEGVFTYVVKREYEYRLGERDWDFGQFLKKGKGSFLSHYSGYDEI